MAERVEPVSSVYFGFLDHSNESSGFRVNLAPMDAETDMAARIVGINALQAAVSALTLCNSLSVQVEAYMKLWTDGVPASKWAQREMALQVGYHDLVTGYKMRISIPGIDWDTFAGDGDWIDYNNILWLAFKTAFELAVKSPAGNAVMIDYAKFVGRRS